LALLVGVTPAFAQVTTCGPVTLADLDAHAKSATAYIVAIKTVEGLEAKLKEQIIASETARLALFKACNDKISEQIKLSPVTAPRQQLVDIVSATYGDHETQAERCAGQSCKLTCSAKEYLKTRCYSASQLLQGLKTDDGSPIKPPFTDSASKPVRTETLLGVGLSCQFSVTNELCYGMDPSPDSRQKSVKVDYACLNAESRAVESTGVVEAGQNAQVTIVCPRKLR
jgi:hypothetical protein